ncbi:MAG: sigma-70 family RNA polymerase sigma factor [bacterium]|nr:sigma-70 family RNA polymerase sigma factor [bacterium]
MSESRQITRLLLEWRGGSREAFDRLLPVVYDELRRMARQHMGAERRDHTLQATALVHEACLRLIDADIEWKDRLHFFGVASRVMRRVLVDHARVHRSAKRGAGKPKLNLDDVLQIADDRPWDLLDVDIALERLGEQDERKARVIELHYFGGLKLKEIAEVLEITPDAVAWDLRMAKAWLRRELGS